MIPQLARHRVTVAWVLLMMASLLTGVAGGVFETSGVLRTASGAAILCIVALKVWGVLYFFMELNRIPVLLQRLYMAWALIAIALLFGLYLWSIYHGGNQ